MITSAGFRQRHRLLILVIIAVFLLLSCQLVNNALRGRSSNPAAGYGVNRDEAIFLLAGQPRTLDPAKTLGGPDSALGHIFSGLVTLDTNLQVQPDLASGWLVSEDGLVYIFYLRQNAVFHDGRRVTAADVIYSWERATDPALGSDTAATYLGDIAGVRERLNGTADHISGLRAIGDRAIEVRLTAPVVYFLAKLTYPVTFIVDRQNVRQSDWEHQPNGTGPYELQVWRDDDIMILERFDNFYLEPAQVRYLVYQLGPGLPLALYETDQLDLVGIGGGALERARDPNDPLFPDLRTGVTLCTSVIGLNTQTPPFNDVRVRQAFNYALDKERLIATFDSGNALVAAGPLPPGMPGYRPGREGYPFDTEKARQLLAEAGYSNPADFPTLEYVTAGFGTVNAYVTAVISLWQESLGVTINPVLLDPFTYNDALYAGQTGNLFNAGWCADYPDPENFLDVLYHSDAQQNLGRFSNPAIDALLEQARVEKDVEARLDLYAQAEQLIIEAAPVVFVDHGLSAVLVKPRVQGYVLTPIGVPQWHHVVLNEE